jgi:transposase-like protein
MRISSIGKARWRSSAAQRAQWVERFKQSGLTQRAFAQRHRLGLSTLVRWLAQARAGSTKSVFAEVKLPGGPHVWAAEMVQSDGRVLRLAHDAPIPLIQHLLRPC